MGILLNPCKSSKEFAKTFIQVQSSPTQRSPVWSLEYQWPWILQVRSYLCSCTESHHITITVMCSAKRLQRTSEFFVMVSRSKHATLHTCKEDNNPFRWSRINIYKWSLFFTQMKYLVRFQTYLNRWWCKPRRNENYMMLVTHLVMINLLHD